MYLIIIIFFFFLHFLILNSISYVYVVFLKYNFMLPPILSRDTQSQHSRNALCDIDTFDILTFLQYRAGVQRETKVHKR